MDRFSPAAAAHIRVLVLPVGRIERQQFLDFVRRLQNESALIRHNDLKDKTGDGDFLLSPRKFEQGCLLLNYTTSTASEAILQLCPYDVFREPLLVLGVVGGLGDDEEEGRKELKAAANYLRERHPRVVHRHLLVLGDNKDNLLGNQENASMVEQPHESGHPSLVNAMQTLAVRFLRELSTYVQAMQASPSIPTPGQPSRNLQRASWMREPDSKSVPGSGYGTPPDVSSPPPGDDGPSRPPSRSITSPATSFDHIPNTNAAVNALARSDSRTSNRGTNGRGSSQDRVPIQGFGTNTSAEKTKKRGRARVSIVVGSLYMMAGMWSDALRLLTEHTTQARTLHDLLWLAKGLENIVVCQLLQAWAEVEFQVPAICQQVVEKSTTKQAAQRFSIESPGESSQEASLRRLSAMLPDLVRQILILYRSSEGPLELPSLVACEATVRCSKMLATLHNNAGTLGKVAREQLVQSGVSGLPMSSGTAAKASFPISRLLAKSAIAEVLVTALPGNEDTISVPDQLTLLGGIASVYSLLHMDRKKAMTIKELVVRLTAALNQARKLGAAEMGIHPAASLSAEHGADSLTASIKESGGLLSMIADVANIYGVNLLGVTETSESESSEQHKHHTRPKAFGGEMLKFSTLRELLALCEASPDPYGILRLIASFFASAGPNAAVDNETLDGGVAIAQDEQAHLASTVSRTIGVSRQLGLTDTHATYWDPYFLRDVTFSPRSTAIELIDWAKLKGTRPSSQQDPANPLLYDPNARRQATADQTSILVQGEPVECVLTLQNPYEIALDIESIVFVTEGVSLDTNCGGLHVGPSRFQQLSIPVTPAADGQMKIKGCRIKMASFQEAYFPIIRKPWSERQSLVVKNLGQEARSGDRDPKQKIAEPEHATVSADVIPSLPSLLLKSTSLPESSIMLLEGEKQTFEATIENITASEASILDVVGSVEGLSVAKVSASVIPPNESVNIALEVVGRAGMSHVRADIFYACTGGDNGFARMLSIPIVVTVNAALQAHHLDVSDDNEDDMVCASFDLGNAWPRSVSFACSVQDSGARDIQQQGIMAPGEVRRIYLRLRRWISEIKSDRNVEEIRKALLDRIRVSWDIESRHGEVLLHNLALRSEAVDVLCGPAIAVQLSLQDASSSSPSASVGCFLAVRVTVNNRSTRSAPLLIELQPSVAGLPTQAPEDRRRTVTGTLSRFVAALKAGEQREVEFALCPLVSGTLEMVATARSALSLQVGDGSGALGESKPMLVKVVQ
ncbi:hypothetical protein Q7P37_010629 [Cladosporium fusiforme]